MHSTFSIIAFPDISVPSTTFPFIRTMMEPPESLDCLRLYVLPQAPLRFIPCFLDLNDNDDFFHVKNVIWEKLEVGEEMQVLSYGGEVLLDEKTPVDYDLRSGAVLLLSLKG